MFLEINLRSEIDFANDDKCKNIFYKNKHFVILACAEDEFISAHTYAQREIFVANFGSLLIYHQIHSNTFFTLLFGPRLQFSKQLHKE
jgi:hypothetical protein